VRRTGVYHFFDPESRPRSETSHLLSSGIPLEFAKIITQINNHDRNLCVLGILPNQLRYLLKISNGDGNTAFELISKEMFWSSYMIWKKRKKFMSEKHSSGRVETTWCSESKKEKDF